MNTQFINADSTKMVETLGRGRFDIAFLDPPYNTTCQEWDKKDVICPEFVDKLRYALSDRASIYLCCGMGEKSQSLIRWFPVFSDIFHFKDVITWKKARGNGNRKGWLYTREELLWFVVNPKSFIWNKHNQYSNETRKRDAGSSEIRESAKGYKCRSPYKRLTNVWDDITEQGKDVLGVDFHYTPKPLKLVDRVIKLHSVHDSEILDPFSGSASTAITAGKWNGLSSVNIELDTSIFDAGKSRYNREINCE